MSVDRWRARCGDGAGQRQIRSVAVTRRRRAAAGEIGARLLGVAVDRGRQRRQVDVFFLVAQLFQEFDAHQLAVAGLVVVEQVHFEQHAAAVVDGRAHAEAGDGRQRLSRQAMHLHHEDAGQGRAVRDAQVQGRKAERAAQLLAVDHVAGHRIRMAEQVRARAAKSPAASAARTADDEMRGRRRASRSAASRLRSRTACRLRSASRHCRRAWRRSRSRRRPSAISRAGRRPARVSMKSCGDMDGEVCVEVFDDDAVDAGVGQRFQLVAQVGDAGRRLRQVAGAAGRRIRADAARRSSRPLPVPGASRPRARAPARPGGRGGHRRSCRSSARRGARPVVGKSAKYLHWMDSCSEAKYQIIR